MIPPQKPHERTPQKTMSITPPPTITLKTRPTNPLHTPRYLYDTTRHFKTHNTITFKDATRNPLTNENTMLTTINNHTYHITTLSNGTTPPLPDPLTIHKNNWLGNSLTTAHYETTIT